LFEYAKNINIGLMAGWPAHTSIDDSRRVIWDVLSINENYAITLKGEDKVIGSIGFIKGNESFLTFTYNEVEMGYWIGEPFWGQGLTAEAI